MKRISRSKLNKLIGLLTGYDVQTAYGLDGLRLYVRNTDNNIKTAHCFSGSNCIRKAYNCILDNYLDI